MIKLEFSPNCLSKIPHHLRFQVYLSVFIVALNDWPPLTFLSPLLSLCLIPHQSPWPPCSLDRTHQPGSYLKVLLLFFPCLEWSSPGMYFTDFLLQSVLKSAFSLKSALRTHPSYSAACQDTSPSLPHSLSPSAAAFSFLIALLPSVLACYLYYCRSPPPRIDASRGQESSSAVFWCIQASGR